MQDATGGLLRGVRASSVPAPVEERNRLIAKGLSDRAEIYGKFVCRAKRANTWRITATVGAGAARTRCADSGADADRQPVVVPVDHAAGEVRDAREPGFFED